ncbi:MAG TPA: serine hydrolase [Terracidiphilus sp.]
MHKAILRTFILVAGVLSVGCMVRAQEDAALDAELKAIAAQHEGKVALFAQNLKTGQTVSLDADVAVKTASTIKMGILLDAAEQIRAGKAKLEEKLVLEHANQVEGSGVLAQLDTPLAVTLKDVLTLMVILSDNTATNMAIDRLGLDQINRTLKAAGLKQTYLYKKVYMPATGPMPADQPKFGLGKTTAREMAGVMRRFAECRLGLDSPAALPGDGPICGTILHMLRNQQDRDDIPRYLESLDTSEHGSAIANKTGALDEVRNDVALIATKNGPVVMAVFTYDNKDQRWTGDNGAQQMIGKLAEMVVKKWSPAGLDAGSFSWEDPLRGRE